MEIKFIILNIAFLMLFIAPKTCRSSVAKEFFVGFPKSFVGFPKSFFQNEVLHIFLTTPHSERVRVSIRTLTGYNTATSVTAGMTREIRVPSYMEIRNENDYDKGIWIVSLSPNKSISVSLMRRSTSSVYLAQPPVIYPGLLEYVYYVIATSYLWGTKVPITFSSTVLLIGNYANTNVIITPSQRIEIPQYFQSGSYPQGYINAGESYTVSLQRMETLHIESDFDLTGTKITSNKPLTVLGSHECIDIPVHVEFCDLIVEQLPPSATWGRFFLVAALHSRSTGEKYKIVGLKRSTTVKIKCVTENQTEHEMGYFTLLLNLTGDVREFTLGRDRLCSIVADKPILLIQYSQGYSLDHNVGGPFMLVIPPVEQYSNNYTVQAPEKYDNHMTISVPVVHFNGRKIFLNDTVLSGWSPVYCSETIVCGYVTRLSVPLGTHRVHHADSDGGLSVSVYGFGYHDDYGLQAGMELNWIADVCQHGEIRLDSSSYDLVETCQDGVWTTIGGGSTGWSGNEASVACRQLGYSQYGSNAYFMVLDKAFFLPSISDVRCTGSELKLSECTYNWNVGEWVPNQSTHLKCYPYYSIGVEISTAPSPPYYTWNQVTLTCRTSVNATNEPELSVEIVWMKEGEYLLNENHYTITGVELNAQMQFESNLTVQVLNWGDDGTFVCRAMAVSNITGQPLSDLATNNISMNLIESDNVIFQIILTGVGHCSDWLLQYESPLEKGAQVIYSIVNQILHRCSSCGMSTNHISDAVFRCLEQNSHRITFRARLHATNQEELGDFVGYLVEWVRLDSLVRISGVLLGVSTECDVVIDSFSSSDCKVATSESTFSAPNLNTPTESPFATSDVYGFLSHQEVYAIIGSTVIVLAILFISVVCSIASQYV